MSALVTAPPTELLCNELAECMFVKNTFIVLQSPSEPHGAYRRSNSSPIIRMPEASIESMTKEQSPSTDFQLVLPFSKPGSQASTDGCSETSFHRFDTCSSEDIPNTPVSTPRSQASLPSALGLQGEDDSTRHTTVSTIPEPPVPWHSFPVEPLAKCCEARPGFTSLNPKAVPWQPALMMVVPQPPESIPLTNFVEAVGAMVNSLQQEIERCVSVPIKVHVIREQRAWSIICRIREEEMEHQDTILQHAKGHILCGAEASDAFHLVGCRTDPFKPKQRGFGAVLASMQDSNLACWDFYATGTCVREHKCRWQHPLFRQRLYVAVKNLTEIVPSSETTAAA